MKGRFLFLDRLICMDKVKWATRDTLYFRICMDNSFEIITIKQNQLQIIVINKLELDEFINF